MSNGNSLAEFRKRISAATTQKELMDISYEALKASGRININLGANEQSLWDQVISLCVARETELGLT